jgi:hypothetical protein
VALPFSVPSVRHCLTSLYLYDRKVIRHSSYLPLASGDHVHLHAANGMGGSVRKGCGVIEVDSSRTIKASREAVWRHLTRVSDWYRWYPGLHGVDTEETITRNGQSWRATGQMGRMLYRGGQRVDEYRMLGLIALEGNRYPWISSMKTRISVEPDGPNCRLYVGIAAVPGLWLPGRILLRPILRGRLQREADDVTERLADYIEHTMPYH